MRYQFYREHKYVSAALNDLERRIAKTDFQNEEEVAAVDQAFQALTEMLKGHAEYENNRLHKLLKDKDSHVYAHAEEDHAHQDEQLLQVQNLIHAVYQASTPEDQLSTGHTLYLTFRKFVADNLLHLHEEETIILPELQRLYTDEELKQVELETYNIMSSEDLVEMLGILFPHMNATDRFAFLSDIYHSQPEKFSTVWKGIASVINQDERDHLEQRFHIL